MIKREKPIKVSGIDTYVSEERDCDGRDSEGSAIDHDDAR